MPPNNYQPWQSPMMQIPSSRPVKRGWGSIIAIVILSILCISLMSFAIWAYMGKLDYKNNVDAKVNAAVDIAKKQEDSTKDKQFVEQEKLPLRVYSGPATYGSIVIQYPKTWSGFVTESSTSSTPIDGFFHPKIIPGLQSGTAFALRVQVLGQSYDQVMQSLSQQSQNGKLTIVAYRAPKVPSVLGSRVTGELNTGQRDDMVIFPLRDKTVEISTQSAEFLNDFNINILANLTFSP